MWGIQKKKMLTGKILKFENDKPINNLSDIKADAIHVVLKLFILHANLWHN